MGDHGRRCLLGKSFGAFPVGSSQLRWRNPHGHQESLPQRSQEGFPGYPRLTAPGDPRGQGPQGPPRIPLGKCP